MRSLVGLPLGGHRLVLKLGVHALHVQKTHYESDTLCSECAKSHNKVVTCFSKDKKHIMKLSHFFAHVQKHIMKSSYLLYHSEASNEINTVFLKMCQ